MFYNGRTDIAEEIDFNKINESSKCIVCNYYYFLKVNLKFQPKVCDGCHSLIEKSMSFNDVKLVSVKGNDHRIHF